jgi:murein DD-endopeptidase MepM/ murein hydrolase activator NlpD
LEGSARHRSDGIAGARRIRDGAWDWSFFENGAAALDRHELWVEPPVRSRRAVSRTPQLVRLPVQPPCDTVPADMPSSRPTRRRRVERREVRAARRTRRFALLTLLAIVLVIALLLTAFGGAGAPRLQRLAIRDLASAQTQPYPQVVATRGSLRLQMPVAQTQYTAIGYHSGDDGALALKPAGRQGNQGLVQRVVHAIFGGGGGHPVWYQLDSGATSVLDVGAAPGTDVYSPVDGTVVGVSPYVVAGRRFGSRIDIQPQSAPSLVVSLTQLRTDPSLTIGSNVVSGRSRVGSVVDLAAVERQALSRYTNDAGNHVSVEVRPAAALVLN